MLRQARHTLGWLVTAAMLLTGCQYDGVLTDLHQDKGADSVAISFGNGVIDAPIRTKAVTLLSEHTNTMGVWGWQTSKSGQVACLFLNQEVAYNPEVGLWAYSPEKYWQDGSSYRFYAYAPHSSTVPSARVSIDEETGHISIAGVTLKGCNTMQTEALPRPIGSFMSVDDTDWLIDRSGKNVPKEQIRTRVTFNMQHILAKFNIMISANQVLADGGTVVLDSLIIGPFMSKADFTQKLNHSPQLDNEDDQAVIEWVIDGQAPRYNIYSTKNAVIPEGGCCVVESLLLPQEVTAYQTVLVSYSVHSEGGRVERFIYSFDLKDAFSSFKCSNNYSLNITLGPDVITFDAGSTVWDDNEAVGRDIIPNR